MKTQVEKLASHDLMKRLLQDTMPLHSVDRAKSKRATKKKGKLITVKPPSLSLSLSYSQRTFQKASPLISAFERLEEVQIYLKKFPQPRTYEKQRITQDKWIEYHYSVHVLTVVSLVDLSLILINEILRIGLSEKHCRLDTILQHRLVKGTAIARTLKELNKEITNQRKNRNLHIHRGEPPKIAEILDSHQYGILRVVTFLKQYDKYSIPQDMIDYSYSKEVTKLLRIAQTESKCLSLFIIDLFNELFPIFEKNSQALKKIEGANPSFGT